MQAKCYVTPSVVEGIAHVAECNTSRGVLNAVALRNR